MVEIISRAEWEYLLHQSYDLQRQIRRAGKRGEHNPAKTRLLRLLPLCKRIWAPPLPVPAKNNPPPSSERKAG